MCRQKLDYFVLRYWYIYIYMNTLRNPREGGCVGTGGQETLEPGRPSQVESLMGQVMPHAGDGPKPMYLYYNTFSNSHHPSCTTTPCLVQLG
jgi:hypothetical protein